MEKSIIALVVLLLFACKGDMELSEDILFRSRQNIFLKNSMVSLIMSDRYGSKCDLVVFNKKGKLVDKCRCPSDPMPSISKINDSTLNVIYHLTKDDIITEETLETDPIVLDGIIIKPTFIYDYYGNGVGKNIYYDSFVINREKNTVSFSLSDKIVIVLNTDNIFSAYGKLKFRENRNGLFVYNYLLSKKLNVEDYYLELIKPIKN